MQTIVALATARHALTKNKVNLNHIFNIKIVVGSGEVTKGFACIQTGLCNPVIFGLKSLSVRTLTAPLCV